MGRTLPSITQAFIQGLNKLSCLPSTNVTGTVIPHFAITDSYQITTKYSLSFINENPHTLSFNSSPTPGIYLRVITKHRHTATGSRGFHARRYSTDKP